MTNIYFNVTLRPMNGLILENFPCEKFRPPRGLKPTTSSKPRKWVRVPVEAERFHMENFLKYKK